jgi:acetyl esterase/lipase
MKTMIEKASVFLRVACVCLVTAVLFAACHSTDIPPQAEIHPAPDTGLYVSARFTQAQMRIYTNLPYSVRPNFKGLQSTSENRKALEKGMDQLTIYLDLVVPPNATSTNKQPLIVMIHGGGYVGGSKEDRRDEALSYAAAGYVAATIDYRLTANNQSSDSLRWLAITHATEDAMNAIRFLKASAGKYNIDTTRVATIGTSAGGGISLVNAISADERADMISDYPGIAAKVQAAVSTGATLIDATIPASDSFLRFDATDTPVLLLHANPTDGGTGATWTGNVLPTQKRIQGSGNTCTLVAQPNLTHTVDLSMGATYWDEVRQFLWEKLRLYEK